MHFRLTKPEDFVTARSFVPPAYCYSPAAFKSLPEIWAELLGTGQLISAVLEDSISNSPGKILGVGLSVFVTDDFADDLLANPRPYVNARLHDMLLAGDSPVLNARQIAKENQNGGLNLLPLHFCTPSVDLDNPVILRALSAAQDLFRVMHGGYKIKRVVKEVVNHQLCRFMQSTGMNLICDYAASRPEFGLEKVPAEDRPYLLAIRYEEMPLGSPLSLLFNITPIRFYFSPAEQKLLLCALLRESDEEIICDLGLTRNTISKRWKSIFQRVMDVVPGFFHELNNIKTNETRGRGKRRHLLRYLQLHMEELRPHGGLFSGRSTA